MLHPAVEARTARLNSMKFPSLAARVDMIGKLAQKCLIKLAPRESGVELLTVDADYASLVSIREEPTRKLGSIQHPQWKHWLEIGSGDERFAVLADIGEKQIAEGNVRYLRRFVASLCKRAEESGFVFRIR